MINGPILAVLGELWALGVLAIMLGVPWKITQLFLLGALGGNENVRGAQAAILLLWLALLPFGIFVVLSEDFQRNPDWGAIVACAMFAIAFSGLLWGLWRVTPADKADHARLVQAQFAPANPAPPVAKRTASKPLRLAVHKTCSTCGAVNISAQSFCHGCGRRL